MKSLKGPPRHVKISFDNRAKTFSEKKTKKTVTFPEKHNSSQRLLLVE